ncbi:MAG: efflux RND transporter permease subunit [Rickettsiales bacterium]|nr:efflux RND transporter permease subunit [Pseudomonadota bacterium]MDA0966028.1 efflux RND transporter permease subunit [Pseudomonadota bacterium]MDG4542501.1 efflux RND transporter permease subunit [Rickettsiales bacterium]MDG4545005.1 efflux RND transporter permease subunit [Rickettsiales bacterium]MDG4547128.1 efflux RND transporter permease subunit [Rickettsiales bacterium]
MDTFIDACINRYRTIILILLLVFAVGTSSYRSIPKEQDPDVRIPFIITTMTHEGISPEDAERLLIKPMEKELRSIEGVKEMTAYATEGRASVTLEFNAGFDSEKALNDVREKVDLAKTELPTDTDEPDVKEINLSLFPVINVIIGGDIPERTLVTIARNLRDKIEELPNVLDVNIAGDREEAVEIEIDPIMIESYRITLAEMNQVANGFNRLIAAGALDNGNGRYSVKVPGLLEGLSDILSLPVKVNGDSVITVRDIAKIKKTFKDPTGFARANGKKSLVLEVSKRTGTNVIETITQVKERVAFEKQFWPEHIDITYSGDKSGTIINMLKDLENNIIMAILLVMIVIIYFVGLRSATLVTIAIPGAFLLGVLFIDSIGLTVNIVVLFSLILSIGMLVDSAIITCEMADRKMTEGKSKKEAYTEAAKYMKWPIIASTATTLVVFMPLLFWPGIVGQFMQYMPITLIATLTGSLLMAIIFIPTIGCILPFKHKPSQKVIENIELTEKGDLEKLKGSASVYYKLLKAVVNHAGIFALFIFLILCSVYVYYAKFGTGVEFFPEIEPETSQIQIRARGNLSVQEKDALVRKVEERIFDVEGIRVFYAKSGAMEGGKGIPEDAVGIVNIEYDDWNKRPKAHKIVEEIKKRTEGMAGIIISAQDEQAGPGAAKPIELIISSRKPELLEPAVTKILDLMSNIEGLVDIEDTRPIPGIEWNMDIDRSMAAKFGADVNILGNFIKFITNGLKMTSYRPDDSDEDVDILIRFPEEKRNLTALDDLKVATEAGLVPISNFVTRKAQPKVDTIYRINGMRNMTIKADVAEGVLADTKVKEAKEMLAQMEQNPDISVRFKGDEEQQNEAQQFLSNAFILALFCMALILVTQFNSIYYMLIILSAVFLSTVGVLLGLIVTGQPFGIVMCGVGVISLSGIVVNNNIIFIDTYQKLKAEGMEPREAVLRTGIQRLRPILLTAGTTVLGLIPMVLALNIDFITREVTIGAPSSQWWRQLSTSIAGGLTFATILTLFFTPSLLIIGDRFFYKKPEATKKKPKSKNEKIRTRV